SQCRLIGFSDPRQSSVASAAAFLTLTSRNVGFFAWSGSCLSQEKTGLSFSERKTSMFQLTSTTLKRSMMKFRSVPALAAFAAALGLAGPLWADTIVFSQPPVNGQGASTSDFHHGQQLADNFI